MFTLPPELAMMNRRGDHCHAQHCVPFESITYGDAAGPVTTGSLQPMASRDNLHRGGFPGGGGLRSQPCITSAASGP